jgi:hypothetical protein
MNEIAGSYGKPTGKIKKKQHREMEPVLVHGECFKLLT